MPVRNGLQTIKDILAIDPALQILAITGENAELNLDIAKELGAVQTLEKPVDPAALREAVRTALG